MGPKGWGMSNLKPFKVAGTMFDFFTIDQVLLHVTQSLRASLSAFTLVSY
jgi:hypothetical protein